MSDSLPNYDAWKTTPPDLYDEQIMDDCPDCDGDGTQVVVDGGDPTQEAEIPCDECDGTGQVPLEPGDHPRSCRCMECDPDYYRDMREGR